MGPGSSWPVVTPAPCSAAAPAWTWAQAPHAPAGGTRPGHSLTSTGSRRLCPDLAWVETSSSHGLGHSAVDGLCPRPGLAGTVVSAPAVGRMSRPANTAGV